MLIKLPEKEYRAIRQLSQSDCKAIRNMSGFEFQHYKREGLEETPSMIKGTLAHQLALEGHMHYANEFSIDRWPSITGKKRNQKGSINGVERTYKSYKDELKEAGKELIKEEDISQAEGMANAIKRDFGKLLAEGQPEIALHDINLHGHMCKGMMDFLPPKRFIFDVKTTSKELNDRQMWKFLNVDLWKIQAAFYHDLFLAETGESRWFVFLIVNNKPPYSTRKILVQPETECMEQGREFYEAALDTYAEYKKLEGGDLPGHPMYKVLEIEQNR